MNKQQSIEQFLFQLSAYCDAQDWDKYLEQYAPEAEYHIPQWKSEHVHATDPKREMSLLYYPNRDGLEDRIFRIRTGKSAASNPMPRTLHLISNVRYQELGHDEVEVLYNWVTHYYRFGESAHFFGQAKCKLKTVGTGWRITYKQVIVLNDKIDSVFDFYHV